MRGGVEAEACAQWPEAAHPGRRVAGRSHRGGRLFGRFDHGDDDRVGARVEHAADRCGIRRRQPDRGGDGNMLEPAQQQRDVGVVEIAVLDVESDVVVAGLGELLGPMTVGPTTQPPNTRSLAASASCSLLCLTCSPP